MRLSTADIRKQRIAILPGEPQTKYKKNAGPYGGYVRRCAIELCEKKHFARGYCHKHYVRLRKYGDPLFCIRPQIGRCLIAGCENGPRYRKGLCNEHHNERKRLLRRQAGVQPRRTGLKREIEIRLKARMSVLNIARELGIKIAYVRKVKIDFEG